MHPVKVHTYNLKAMTHTISELGTFPIDRAEVTPHGLHYLRSMPGHPAIARQEVHLLPGLDLAVTHFTPLPGQPEHSRYYVDMALYERPADHLWILRDLYLDVIIGANGLPKLVDSDEYAAAIMEGHLTPDELTRAILSAERVLNGLFAHDNDLEAWLASLGVHLEWWGTSPAATMRR